MLRIDDTQSGQLWLTYVSPRGVTTVIAKATDECRPFLERAIAEWSKPAKGGYRSRQPFEEALSWVLAFEGKTVPARQLQDCFYRREINTTRADQGGPVGSHVRDTWRKALGCHE